MGTEDGALFCEPSVPPLPGISDTMPTRRELSDADLCRSFGSIVLQVPKDKYGDFSKHMLPRILSAGLRARIYASCDPEGTDRSARTVFVECYFGSEVSLATWSREYLNTHSPIHRSDQSSRCSIGTQERLIYAAWRNGYLVELDARRLRQFDVQRNRHLEEQAQLRDHSVFEADPLEDGAEDAMKEARDVVFGIPQPTEHPCLRALRCMLCTDILPMEDRHSRDPYRYLRS